MQTPAPRTRRRSAAAPRRTSELTVRLAPDELGSVRAAAAAAGVSMADLARRRLLDAGASLTLTTESRAPKRRKFTAADPALIAQIARAGNNLNQIARRVNAQKTSIDSVQLLALLTAIQRDLTSLVDRGD